MRGCERRRNGKEIVYISDQGSGGGSGSGIICKTSVREPHHSVAQVHHLRFVGHHHDAGMRGRHHLAQQLVATHAVGGCGTVPAAAGYRGAARGGWGAEELNGLLHVEFVAEVSKTRIGLRHYLSFCVI